MQLDSNYARYSKTQPQPSRFRTTLGKTDVWNLYNIVPCGHRSGFLAGKDKDLVVTSARNTTSSYIKNDRKLVFQNLFKQI